MAKTYRKNFQGEEKAAQRSADKRAVRQLRRSAERIRDQDLSDYLCWEAISKRGRFVPASDL